ncbi:hypothetical protein ACFVKB_17025 [Rhodococcus sp. NPDC127530]|uniref:hypothetical protein n=1 Tax=unclassified Rhodococcus (in: high G+C Gram-positive bacteria) TaxID=192944 RepID=UPI00362F68E1
MLAALTTSLLLYSAVTYFVRYSDERDSAAIAEDAAATAGDLSAAALSYTADSVEADVNAAKSHLTGEFLASYSELAANSIIPQATRDGIITKWEVSGTSLISAHLGSAEALVFLRGTVSSQVNPEPQFMTSSVRVRLEHGNDQWLIAQLEPI